MTLRIYFYFPIHVFLSRTGKEAKKKLFQEKEKLFTTQALLRKTVFQPVASAIFLLPSCNFLC